MVILVNSDQTSALEALPLARKFDVLSSHIDGLITEIATQSPVSVFELSAEIDRLCTGLKSRWSKPLSNETTNGPPIRSDRRITHPKTTEQQHDVRKTPQDADKSEKAVVSEAAESESQRVAPKRKRDPIPQTAIIPEAPLSTIFIRPGQVVVAFEKQLKSIHHYLIPQLVRLFYGIAGPSAFLQLRDACLAIRGRSWNTTQRPQSDIAHSAQSLDLLDSTTCAGYILRRYYLARLVAYRDERFDHHLSLRPTKTSRTLKFGYTKETQIPVQRGTKLAAGKALTDLMAKAYPELCETRGLTSKLQAVAQRSKQIMHRRLASGRNWRALERRFSMGVLALVPNGGEAGVFNHEIEELPKSAFALLLDMLVEHRGIFLKAAGSMLDKHIFDILLAHSLDFHYPLERFVEDVMTTQELDSIGMLMGCCTMSKLPQSAL